MGWGVLLRHCFAALAAKLPESAAISRRGRQFKGDLAAGSGNLAARLVFEQVQKVVTDKVDIYIVWRYNGFMYIDLRYILRFS